MTNLILYTLESIVLPLTVTLSKTGVSRLLVFCNMVRTMLDSSNKSRFPTTILPLRSVEVGIKNRTNTVLDALNSLGQEPVEILGGSGMSGPQIMSSGCFGKAGVVGRRNKRDVELLVGGFSTETVRVDEREGLLGCVPAYEV